MCRHTHTNQNNTAFLSPVFVTASASASASPQSCSRALLSPDDLATFSRRMTVVSRDSLKRKELRKAVR